ncbi:hypothetical protein M758_6G092100 [Ceratodon purpureus]|nr:hypothetical protein M758_6G092100 [Ceratodon purpureus]
MACVRIMVQLAKPRAKPDVKMKTRGVSHQEPTCMVRAASSCRDQRTEQLKRRGRIFTPRAVFSWEDVNKKLQRLSGKRVNVNNIGSVLGSFGDNMSDHRQSTSETKGQNAFNTGRIFLSHSGAQKNFVRQLDVDLRRVQQLPFFDEDYIESMKEGSSYPQLIFEAAAKCDLAVLVLSEEFFTLSMWPMLELVAFMEAREKRNPELQILPLYYGLSVSEFKDETRQARWFRKWEEWIVPGPHPIDIMLWKKALKALYPIIGLEYAKIDNEVKYRDQVVAVVCKLVVSGKFDDPYVQDKEQLCKDIDKIFVSIPASHEGKILGIWGMSGLGKSTLCRTLCNYYYSKYNGKVCHVEFGGPDATVLAHHEKAVSYGKQILGELTEASESVLSLITSSDQVIHNLRKRFPLYDTFLALDNVWDDDYSSEATSTYIKLKSTQNSKVIVTARNCDTLVQLGIDESRCYRLPSLSVEQAEALFLHHAEVLDASSLSSEQKTFMEKTVDKCFFPGVEQDRQFIPLALKVLGNQCKEVLSSPGSLQKFEKGDFQNHFNIGFLEDKRNHLDKVLRVGYDSLTVEEKLVFMDIVISMGQDQFVDKATALRWLELLHEDSHETLLKRVAVLKRNALVEEDAGGHYRVHDLYKIFCSYEITEESDMGMKIILGITHHSGSVLPSFTTVIPTTSCWPLRRLYILSKEKGWSRLKLHYFSNIGMLMILNCRQIGELNLNGLVRLRSLSMKHCCLERIVGLDKLDQLAEICLVENQINEPLPGSIFLRELLSLRLTWKLQTPLEASLEPCSTDGNWRCPALEDLYLKCCPTSWIWPMAENLKDLCIIKGQWSKIDITCYPNLRELLIYDIQGLNQIYGIDALHQLETFTLGKTDVKILQGIENCSKLIKFEVKDCHTLAKLTRHRCSWDALEILHITECSTLRSLENLGPLPALRQLTIKNCPALMELPNLQGSQYLENLHIQNCKSLMEVMSEVVTENGYYWEALKTLHITVCSTLTSLGNLGPFPALRQLTIENCPALVELPDLQSSQALENFHIHHCTSLMEITSKVDTLPALVRFSIQHCPLMELPNLMDSQCLEVFDVVLTNLTSLAHVIEPPSTLKALNIECPLLTELPQHINYRMLHYCNVCTPMENVSVTLFVDNETANSWSSIHNKGPSKIEITCICGICDLCKILSRLKVKSIELPRQDLE